MKYIVRPRAWLDIEETMKYLRDQAGDETAIAFGGARKTPLRGSLNNPAWDARDLT